ncbi:MAG: hypothetical protein IKP54_00360 [Bacteroidales bacterium]|nr:hypothetical protein [Bacteroidales bacterium]
MEELSELAKTLLMGLYNTRPDKDYKFSSVKEICSDTSLGITVIAARELLEAGLIKCQDEACTYANITEEGVEYVEKYLLAQENEQNVN